VRVSTTNALGFVSTTIFDQADRAVAMVDALGNTTTTVFDAGSLVVAQVDPLGNAVTSIVDSDSRLVATVDPLGNRTSFGFDADSRQVSVTDALGSISTTIFDSDSRVLASISANGFATTQVYDAVGQRLAIIDARGNRTSVTWDGDGRQTGSSDALGNLMTYQFDAASRRVLRIDGRGLLTSYVYDADSRLTGQQYQDGTRATMTYDANSRRKVLNDWTGLYTSAYDPDGRLSSVVNPAAISITYNYDAVGQRATMAEPTGTFTYVYDPAGRISNLTNPEGQVTSWSYDNASRVTAQLLANGVRVSNTYDNADHLLLLANLAPGGTTLSSFAYTYNPVGNRTQLVEVDGSVVTWTYDPTYQLTNEQRSGASSYNITYAYDAVGNRTLLVNNGAPTTYAYNSANEVATSQASAGVTTYTFDGDGNLLTAVAPGSQLTTNTWDGENRLTKVALPSGIVDTFTYNGDGQRVQKQDSTGTTNHVWDGQNILLETNASNIIQVVCTLEPVRYGNLISQSRQGADSFYLFNGLGSTIQLSNNIGEATDEFLFDSFGNTLFTTGSTSNAFRFVGRFGYYYDADPAKYQLRAREYDPGSARFMAGDPLGHGSWEVNLYWYAANNPIASIDPSGALVTYWLPTPRRDPKNDPRYQGGFKLCQRDILGDDVWTYLENQGGGAHTYIQFGPVDASGNPLPGTTGYGWAGATGQEQAFRPNSCVALCRSSGNLLYGFGAGKPGTQATDSEILDCLKNTKGGKPYSFYWYNCAWWAKSRAIPSCGLGYCPAPWYIIFA
jgi:RHS repeat-associated protein